MMNDENDRHHERERKRLGLSWDEYWAKRAIEKVGSDAEQVADVLAQLRGGSYENKIRADTIQRLIRSLPEPRSSEEALNTVMFSEADREKMNHLLAWVETLKSQVLSAPADPEDVTHTIKGMDVEWQKLKKRLKKTVKKQRS